MSSDLTKYKKLSEVEHILQRSGMYIGTTSDYTIPVFLYDDSKKRMKERKIRFNPGLLKLFDEIVSNSVDEHIRSGSVDRIDVNISRLTGEITVKDNGGIPVKKHPEYDTYIPSMIFGELRTGSNFSDDERTTAGLNGLGAKLTAVFSKQFSVLTCDGKKKFYQKFEDNLKVVNDPVIKSSNVKGTTITFLPDYERLNCSMTVENYERIVRRVYDIAGCNPKIDVYLDGTKIKTNKFEDYVALYTDDFVYDSCACESWEVCVSPTKDDEFKQISFVNGVDTFNGGTHIDHVVNQITDAIRDFIRKKHKVDVKPNNIKQQMFVFINCSINAPSFTSQTKEYMDCDVKDIGNPYKPSEKLIKKLLKSSVVENILDWVEAQKRKQELAELRKLNKQTNNTNYLKKIVKFDDATSKKREECDLLLVEGDSAGKAILSSRDPKTKGVYPLKGKLINVRDVKISRLTSNQEFANLMSILGLAVGKEYKIEDLRFGRVVITTDQDVDGSHICGLIINMFNEFWPDLLKQGLLYKLKTPLIVATEGKNQHEFFSKSEYELWNKKDKPHKIKYHKGLGGWQTKDFKRFLNDPKYLEQITFSDEEDLDCIDLAFNKKRADDRKDWLAEN